MFTPVGVDTTSPCSIPMLHLICGPVAAGKSTYAQQLATEAGGIVLSLDQWLSDLFLPDVPANTSVSTMERRWFAERVDRCERAMWRLAEQMLAMQIPVILDWGFLRHERREKARTHARQLGIATLLHVLDAELAVRRQRVEARNRDRTGHGFAVTPEMFAFAEQLYEPPVAIELQTMVTVSR